MVRSSVCSLADIPQKRVSDAIFVASIEKWVDLEVLPELLGEGNVSFVVEARLTENQDGIFIFQGNQLVSPVSHPNSRSILYKTKERTKQQTYLLHSGLGDRTAPINAVHLSSKGRIFRLLDRLNRQIQLLNLGWCTCQRQSILAAARRPGRPGVWIHSCYSCRC